MVRKRGVARKSFSHRRVRRVKKYDHHVVPRRFKIYLPRMSDLLEEELPPCVLCEEPTMALLQSLGVPTEEWQYYLGFMKRMIEFYQSFTSETLQKEKDSLIAEYVYRGKDKDVLEQVQVQVEICVGVRVPELEEGNFSSYSIIASFDDADSFAGMRSQDGIFNGNEEKITIIDTENMIVKTYDIPSLTLGVALFNDITEFDGDGGNPHYHKKSIYGTYLVLSATDGVSTEIDRIRIFKNGAQLQTLTYADLGLDDNSIYNVAISPTGKYIIVSGRRTASGNMGWVLLEGS